MILPMWVTAAGVGVALALGGAGGWKVAKNKCEANLLKVEREYTVKLKEEMQRNVEASQATEEAKEKIRVLYSQINKEIERVSSKPTYSVQCLDDDGLRAANAALAGPSAPASKPNK